MIRIAAIIVFLFINYFASAQDSISQTHITFNSASVNRKSFNERLLQDSIFSFRSRKGYIPSLLYNAGRQATFPIRIKGNQFIFLAGTAIITSSLIHYDNDIDAHFRKIKDSSGAIRDVSPQLTELGNYYGYIALAAYGSYSFAFHKYRGFRTSLLASQALISTGIWVTVFKTLSSRMRPEATYADPQFHSDHWFGPFARFNKKYSSERGLASFESFFSGHTSAAFALAVVFSDEYKEMKALPVTLYSVATLIGVTRMIEHKHWSSDVFIGGIVGYLCGRQVISHERKTFPEYLSERKKIKSYFYPCCTHNVAGLEWKMVF